MCFTDRNSFILVDEIGSVYGKGSNMSLQMDCNNITKLSKFEDFKVKQMICDRYFIDVEDYLYEIERTDDGKIVKKINEKIKEIRVRDQWFDYLDCNGNLGAIHMHMSMTDKYNKDKELNGIKMMKLIKGKYLQECYKFNEIVYESSKFLCIGMDNCLYHIFRDKLKKN